MPEPSIDTTFDPQIAALAALVKGAVNYDLRNDNRFEVTEDVIVDVYGYPRPLPILSQSRLPALCIWRANDTIDQFTMYHRFTQADFHFDYLTDHCSYDNLERRWPVLRAIWRRIQEVVYAGRHPQVQENRKILLDIGFKLVDERFTRAHYDYAPDAEKAKYNYPYFTGQIQMSHDDFDPAGDPALFLSLHGSYLLDGLEDTEQPLLESLTYTPTGEDALDAKDNPADPNFMGENI